MDSDWLRRMSLQNAKIALEQAKFQSEIQKRINGGPTLSDRIKDKRKGMLTIQNVNKLKGKSFNVRLAMHQIHDVLERFEMYEIVIDNMTSGGRYELHLQRDIKMDVDGDRYYDIYNPQQNSNLRIHPNHMKRPEDLVKIIENYANH